LVKWRLLRELGRFGQARESFRTGLEQAEKAGGAVDARGSLLCLACVAYLEGDEDRLRAYERVMLVASKTTDPELKRSWLENVEVNRQIVEEWVASGGTHQAWPAGPAQRRACGLSDRARSSPCACYRRSDPFA
jgi:hypothetical protein